MLPIIARLRRMAFSMPRRSPLRRVMPALSIATSVPVPIAMPTSAAASAGASLMPSPAIATTWPCSRSLTNAFVLVLRLDAGVDFIDAELLRDGACGALVVAGEHDDFDAELMQMVDGSGGRFFDRIGDGEDARGASVNADEHRAVALVLKLRGFGFEICEITDALRFQKRRFADEHAPPIDFASDTAASGRFEVSDVRRLNATLGRAAHDRGSERMFAIRFDGRSSHEQLLLGDRRRGNDVRQARFAFG